MSADDIRVAKVTRGLFVRDVSVEGNVIAAVSPTLYSKVNGTVTFNVRAGDTVKKGQVLANIDSPELTSDLKQESATLLQMQTDLGRERINVKKAKLLSQQQVDLANLALQAARRELQRAESAWKYRVIPQQDYEKAKDALAAAKVKYKHTVDDTKLDKEGLNFDVRTQELKVKRQTLLVADLQRRVDALALRSPVNGIVGDLAVQQKAAVIPNQALLTVIDLSALEIAVDIPESYADGLALGMKAKITYGGNTYPGKLTAISPEVQSNQVLGRVRFVGKQPAGLKQNQRVSVRILMDSRDNVLMLQRGPFLNSGGGSFAYVIHNGVATRTPIQTGAVSISQVEILKGLKQGDAVIVSDTDDFNNAQTVYIRD
ncbi:MAG TPA: efflux RND transporter periplasmic adaptor subunit [Gammaproteobacteria bacterium]|nr:efflux RND transporter periplasmic adaptor subunit [Gammaproteobacteria bacterium]